MKLEVIVTTLKEAIDAEKAGADRVELITGVNEGGLTPSLALIEKVCDTLTIPVNIMVRPHAMSFCYDEFDKEVILRDVELISNTKANAIVFGALDSNNNIDIDLLQRVISKKGDKLLTFHRAFDKLENQKEGIDILSKYDVDMVLTSGGKDSAIDAVVQINKLAEHAKGKIKILAGSGIKATNIHRFLDVCGPDEVHAGSGAKDNNSNYGNINYDKISTLKSHFKFKK